MELGFLLSLTLEERMPGAGLAGVVVVGTWDTWDSLSPRKRLHRVLTTGTGAEILIGQ